MRRGIGALFVAFLAVRIISTSPATPTAAPVPAPLQKAKNSPPQAPPRLTRAGAAKNADATPDPCKTKSEDCPKKGLLDAMGASFKASEVDSDLSGRLQDYTAEMQDARFLIATVPDPVHTHLSLLFDRQIVAIEEAVQQEGYLFSRAYLPWDDSQHAEDSDFRVRLGQQDYQDQREDYPGVLLFHARQKAPNVYPGPNPLLVFLVAETPTAGIDRQQFSAAFQAIQDLCRKGCADQPPPGNKQKLFILGPTFSGSFYSLREILQKDHAGEYSGVTIHSGTATSDSTIRWFRAALHMDDSPGNANSFRTFEEGSDYALNHLLGFLCGQGYRADQVAVLSEDETAYGEAPEEDLNPSASAKSETCQNGDPARALHMNFPRDISALRNAYQQDSKIAAASGNSGAPRSTLTLNLQDHGNNNDSVAIFSQDQSPLSEEAVMMGIVSDLRDHRINQVVIEATNPVDIAFLVRYLRSAYSGARILTVGSDLLLPRQVDDPRLRGVMQVTTYPLVPEIDRYIGAAGVCGQSSFLNRIFPSDYSVGTFNALLSLVELQRGARARCRPASSAPDAGGHVVDLPGAGYAQYGWPTLAGDRDSGNSILVPPLWLTALGRDQFWPVELLDGPGAKTGGSEGSTLLHAISFQPRQEEEASPRLPSSWIAALALGFAFALTYVLLTLNGTIISSSIFLANFAPVNDSWRSLTISVCGVIFFDILICLYRPVIWYRKPLECLFLVPVMAVCLMILWDLWRRGRWRWVTVAIALGSVSFVLLEFAFRDGSGPLPNFMKYRYAHIGSGVSPVVPFLILFAACLWAGWYSLSGRPPWDLSGTGPVLPSYADVISEDKYGEESPVERQRLAAITTERNGHLLKAMRPGKLNKRILVPAGITWAVLLCCGIIPGSPWRIQSLDGRSYDWVYTGFVVLIVFMLLADASCLGLIWLELRRLLVALDRLPLRRGFARMSGFNTKRLWQLGGSTFEDYFAILAKEIQTITAVTNTTPAGSNVPDALRDTRAGVAHFAWWVQNLDQQDVAGELSEAQQTQKLTDRLLDLQPILAATCSAVLRELNEAWNRETRPVWEAECIIQDKSQCKDQDLPPSVQLREDFVCLFYLNFISSVFTRMRSLVLTIAGLYVFLLLSFSSYPFEPSSAFHTAMIFLLIVIAVVVGIVYGQAHKNATLSWITDTKAGELGTEFWFRLAAVVAVPLLSLLAARFPGLGGFLFSWLEPASQAFR